MKKRILALLMAATMVFGLAACGNGGTTTDNGSQDAGKQVATDTNITIWVADNVVDFTKEQIDAFKEANPDFADYDYVVDAVDTVAAKIDIVTRCKSMDIPVISSMGTGNKLDPSKFQISDISKTRVCPLAKVTCSR